MYNSIVVCALALSVIAFDFVLVIARALTFPAVWGLAGFILTLGLLALSLFAAAIFVTWFAGRNLRSEELGFTAILGLLGGGILIAHLALEDFAPRVGEDARLTVGVMLGAFTLWFVAGVSTARYHSRVFTGATAGCWAAVISVLPSVTFGFAGTFFNVPASAYVATWPEYLVSGSSNPKVFAISNTFDAGTSHIFVALVLGTLLGACGAFVRTAQTKGLNKT